MIYDDHKERNEPALRAAIQNFNEHESPKIWEPFREAEDRYYANQHQFWLLDMGVEGEDWTIALQIPHLEETLAIFERVGITWIDALNEHSTLEEIEVAVELCRERIPEEILREMKRQIECEQSGSKRFRDAPSMDM
jgi:hypothetical protein